ncbi:hypothetical protein KX401_24450 [Escherichia coli]|uniref:hypothetical protein n=1 Tax=Escherichia coli TaxID=562 RepID=UPI0012FF5F2C|nr:hypothetical protein [Escherichia coli]EEQ4634570.1 hypothetical protein [Escherichia coli]EEV7055181.1 hypothetical protein [Escherichia coli]EGA0336226.1 hypothetical protein [Escherichia coli]MCD3633059.1 hypothetical protein [Escherichia coli]MCD4072455.1 hypothetical protein [Escherichia coli]
MKKNIISTVIAAALCAVAGSAMAAQNIATDTAVLTSNVRAVSGATVTATPIDVTVTTDEIKVAGTHVSAVTVDASGLYDGTKGANVKLTVDPSHYESGPQKWLFKDASGNSFKVTPQASGWNFNGGDVTKRTDGMTSVNGEQIDMVTVSGNGDVPPGAYTMPVTLSFNTW